MPQSRCCIAGRVTCLSCGRPHAICCDVLAMFGTVGLNGVDDNRWQGLCVVVQDVMWDCGLWVCVRYGPAVP